MKGRSRMVRDGGNNLGFERVRSRMKLTEETED